MTAGRFARVRAIVGRRLVAVPAAIRALVASPGRPRQPRAAALWLLPVLVLGVWPYRAGLLDPVPFLPDEHAYMSIGLAVSAEYCGTPGLVSDRYSIGKSLATDRRLLRQPISEVLALIAGSRQAYCDSARVPFLNNENSMMLLMRAAFRLVPRASASRVGSFLSLVRLAIVVLFAYTLLRIGAAIPFSVVTLWVLCDIIRDLRFFQYSIYSFFIPLLISMIALYALAATAAGRRGMVWATATFLGAGFLSAFAVNMRSSHLPVYLALFAVSAFALRGRLRTRPAAWIFATIAVVCFALSYAAFGRMFIRPITPDRTGSFQNFSHHVIAHPLVLGLGVPQSRLTRREGIDWNDSLGPELARRMIPDAEYLGRGYEEGLLLYYARLWLLYPDEMVGVYRAKLRMAGTGMFARPHTAMVEQRVARVITRLGTIDSGSQFLVIYLAVFITSGVLYWRNRRPLALFMLLLTVPALLLFLESAIIMSAFYLQYHGYLLFYSAVLLLLALQGIVDALVRLVEVIAGAGRRTRAAVADNPGALASGLPPPRDTP